MKKLLTPKLHEMITAYEQERREHAERIASIAGDIITAAYRETGADNSLRPFTLVRMFGHDWAVIYNHEANPEYFNGQLYYSVRKAKTVTEAFNIAHPYLRQWFNNNFIHDIIKCWRGKNELRDLQSEKQLFLSYYA